MFKHYLKAAIRSIKRNFLFSSINMLGFILGISAAFLIYLWIVDEMTFEDFHENKNSIYRVIAVSQDASGNINETSNTVAPLADTFVKEITHIKNATFIKYDNKRSLEYKDHIVEGNKVYASSTFFDVFSFPLVEGDFTLFKKDLSYIVLSESMATKLFGDEPATGKQVLYQLFDRKTYYTVAAVVKVPRKSHIKFDIVNNSGTFPLLSRWNFNENITTYIELKENISLSEADRKAMGTLLARHTNREEVLAFQPLTDIHLHTEFKERWVDNHGNITQIYQFALLALLIIFMGAFNFTTLFTARASLRFKEIGVRKVTGAKRKNLIRQFLSESIIQAFVSLLLALALTELLLPLFNQLVDKDISLHINWQLILFVLFGIFGIGCLAGSYPAFYLSSFNPILAFKGGRKSGKKGTFIKLIVSVQFVIAILLILSTSIMYKQLNYIQNQDLGLDKENIVSVYTNLWYDVDEFKKEVLKNPHVLSVTLGAPISDYLKGYTWTGDIVKWTNNTGATDSLRMLKIWGDGDFARTFKLRLIKGEFFESDNEAFWKGTYDYPVIINETAMSLMNVDDPVGMHLKTNIRNGVRIVGVVEDFNFQSLRETIKPAMVIFNPEAMTWLHIRIAPGQKQETIRFLEEKYKQMNSSFKKTFNYTFFNEELNRNYANEQQQSKVFLIFTLLAIIIAIMGVFGLVSLSTRQRTKEIGIRKINGAYTSRIVLMFCYEYLYLIGIAFVIACPIAYLFMHNWLSNFAYRTSLSWWLFPMAGLIVLAITLITVIAQTYRMASQNPVASLRYE